MIDYTDVDRQLIYKNRSKIDDFKVDEMSARPEHPFYNRLISDRFMLLSDDAAKYALDIFNDAYYICTLFYMLDHPLSYLGKLRNKIITKYKGKYLSTATMSLVYNLLGLEQYGNPYGERYKFVKLWLHFIAEDGERNKIFNDFTIAIFPGTQFSKIKYPNTAERFERRDIFEILHAKGYEMICVKDIDYVIEEVMGRKPAEEAVKELTALRKKLEAYFKKYDILEYSEEDFNAWMIARDKIDAVIGYDEDEKNDVDNKEDEEGEENNTEDPNIPVEYDTTFDYIFDPRVKPEAVKKALDGITLFNKQQRPFWFVFMKVLVHLQWIPSSTNTKDVLSWASLQYNLNWTTPKQLSFSDIGGDNDDMNRKANERKKKKIKVTDIILWNTISEKEFRDIEKYRQFALLLKKTFVHFIVDGLERKEVTDFNLGKPRDCAQFMKSPNKLINWGK